MRQGFRLPDIGEGLHEAEILAWHVQVGDAVRRDQVVCEIQTDKAAVELPSPYAGTVVEIAVPAGRVATVGDLLFVVETDTDAVVAAAEPSAPVSAAAAPGAAPGREPPAAGGGAAPLAAPAVRRRAREMGVDLRTVRGSGPGGRITMDDLAAAGVATASPAAPAPAATAPAPDAAAGPDETEAVPLRGVRRIMAERMEISGRIPAFTATDFVDVHRLVGIRKRLQERFPDVKLTYLPFVVKAVAQTLAAVPWLNGHYEAETMTFTRHRRIHIGVATAAPQGLLVPVIRDVQEKAILDLARELAALAERARAGQVERSELTGSTFTITNYGAVGGLTGTPMINPPEVAILGTGRIEEMARREGETWVMRPMLHLALTVDHRVVDGETAARFLVQLRSLLADPALLAVALR